MTDFKRARGAKEKEQRRKAILASATKLFLKDNSALPTTAQIGKDAGVAKGTLYLYFRSKEEIYLAILEEYHQKWLTTFHKQGHFDESIMLTLLDNCVGYMQDNPLYMQLATIGSTVIEQNVDSKILLVHKNHQAKALRDAAKYLCQMLPHMTEDEAAALIMRSYALLIGLWQLSHPSDNIAKVLMSPSLQILQPDFATSARYALQQLWQGTLVSGKPEKGGIWKKLFK